MQQSPLLLEVSVKSVVTHTACSRRGAALKEAKSLRRQEKNSTASSNSKSSQVSLGLVAGSALFVLDSDPKYHYKTWILNTRGLVGKQLRRNRL